MTIRLKCNIDVIFWDLHDSIFQKVAIEIADDLYPEGRGFEVGLLMGHFLEPIEEEY